jgi:hypothetical protein
MRKSRIKLTEVKEDIFDFVIDSPVKFFSHLDSLRIEIPEWSKVLFLSFKESDLSIEVTFYEDAKDFFLLYTKRIIKRKKYTTFSCFSREESSDWKQFTPPTLIGVNLKTKLRKANE